MASQPTPTWINQYSPDNPPVIAPPAGVIPEYHNPSSINWQIYVTAGICVPLILMFTGLWFWSRSTVRKAERTWALELLFGLTVLFVLVYIGICISAVSAGFYGKHLWDVLLKDITKRSLVLSFLSAIFYIITLYALKVCIFCRYLSIFRPLRWMRILSMAAVIIIGLYSSSVLIAWSVMCAPANQGQLGWLFAFAGPRCIRAGKIVISQGVMNVISDVYMIVLPMPAVWSLQLQTKKKIGVSAIFLTGICALLASILGLYFRVRMQDDSHGTARTDVTRITVPNWVTTIVEMTAGVMVFCMPSLAGIFQRCKTSLLSTVTSTRNLLHRTRFSRQGNDRSESFLGRSTNFPSQRDNSMRSLSSLPVLGYSQYPRLDVPEVPPLPPAIVARDAHIERIADYAVSQFRNDNLVIRKQSEVTVTHGIV